MKIYCEYFPPEIHMFQKQKFARLDINYIFNVLYTSLSGARFLANLQHYIVTAASVKLLQLVVTDLIIITCQEIEFGCTNSNIVLHRLKTDIIRTP